MEDLGDESVPPQVGRASITQDLYQSLCNRIQELRERLDLTLPVEVNLKHARCKNTLLTTLNTLKYTLSIYRYLNYGINQGTNVPKRHTLTLGIP